MANPTYRDLKAMLDSLSESELDKNVTVRDHADEYFMANKMFIMKAEYDDSDIVEAGHLIICINN